LTLGENEGWWSLIRSEEGGVTLHTFRVSILLIIELNEIIIMGKIKLPKSLLRLLFPKKRKSTNSNNNTTTGSKANPSHGGSGGGGVIIIPGGGGSVEKSSSPGLNYNNNIAVIEDDDDDDDNTTNYTTEAEESILSLAPPLPPISLEELLQQGSATATTSSNQHYNDSDTEGDAEDVILRPLKHTVDATTIQLDVDDDATHHVITPPSSPGNAAAIVNTRNDTDVVELDDDSSNTIPIDINTTATTIIHPDQDGGSSSLPSDTTTTTLIESIPETFQTPPIIFDPTTTTTTSTKTKKNKSSSRVQFSLHGEEARQRAMARQRKILSKAHLRLDSISETSLEHIKEVTTTSSTTCDDDDDEAVVKEEEEECILLLGDSSLGSSSSAAAKSTKLKRHHRRQQQQQSNNDDVASSSASSVASIASSSYSWGRGKHRGNVSSYIFYESPTSPNNTSKSSSSPLSPLEKGDAAPSMTSMMGDDEEEIGAVTDATKDNICSYSATIATTTATTNHDGNDASAVMQFFILLLCPTSRIFELLEINDYTTTTTNATTSTIDETKSSVTTTTIQDILRNAIPKHCTDERLLLQNYIGLVRAEDKREFMELNAKAFFVPSPSSSEEGGEHRFIQRNDLLVAILEGYTGYQMAKVSKPILRNTKFCEMIRRRCAAAGGGANPSSMVKSSGSRGESRPPLSSSKSRRNKKSDNNHRVARSAVSTGFKDDAYLSLCQQLKQLSKKLHIVDDEIAAAQEDDGVAASPVSPQANKRSDEIVEGGEGQVVAVIDSTATTTPMKGSNNNSFAKFKMTPKMVAYELAMNIEDIFADHDVEIVAVDADDDDDDDDETTTMAGLDGETIDADAEFDDRTTTDDDTFVSARSMRSLRSSRSMRSMLRKNENRSVIVADNDGEDDENNIKPVMEITTKRKERKVGGRTARGNRSMFDNYEEDDMMLQIEAMARQAESEFESRKKGAVEVSIAKFESVIDVKTNTKADMAVQDLDAIVDDEVDVVPSISGDNDADDDIMTSSPIPTHKPSSSSQSERDALARSFLNASTTMVSTMVAASQGRVNEVHVLQYLGVTIVCIAANFMQQARSATAGGPMSPSSMGGGFGSGGGSGFGARDVLQSAMFLAFMVNGQRYMAKVTKK
jgi:hypothetical protein